MVNIIDDDKSLDLNLVSIPKINTICFEEGTESNLLSRNSEKEIQITYRLSQEDMIVLNNIVNLSLTIIFFSVAIIIQGILISFTPVLYNSTVFFILKGSILEKDFRTPHPP